MSLFDYIQITMSEETARKCAKAKTLYFPYIPLQVTKTTLSKEKQIGDILSSKYVRFVNKILFRL